MRQLCRERMAGLEEAKKVFDIEIEALKKTRESLGEDFLKIIDLVTACSGKVVVTGVGKPGHIATKIAATFSSLGTPSFFLHPDEAMHGDLGMVSRDDVVIAISYSGESDEITKILSAVKLIGATLVGITGNKASTLAKACDVVQILPEFREACHMGIAPTSSTTVELCYGDALAVVASQVYGFDEVDFGKFHPAGALGKKLHLKVKDLMKEDAQNAIVYSNMNLKDVIVELSKKKLGVVNVFDDHGKYLGIITGGDVYRALEKGCNIYEQSIVPLITEKPITITSDCLAIEALNIMKSRNIISMPVIEEGKLKGTIIMQDLLTAGLI